MLVVVGGKEIGTKIVRVPAQRGAEGFYKK